MIRISDGDADDEIALADLPLAIGLDANDRLLTGGVAEPAASLWLRNHNERFYLQPEPGGYPATHNGEPIIGSVWLEAGDRIEIGALSIRVDGGEGTLSLTTPRPVAGEEPPDDPAPAPRPETEKAAPPPEAMPTPPRARKKLSRSTRYFAAVFALLAIGVGFVLSASPVKVTVEPSPSAVSLSGLLPPIPLGERYLALPGSYKVRASLPGYRPLEQSVDVRFGETHEFGFQMKKLPGLLSVTTRPDVPSEIRIDGNPAGQTPATDLEIDPGRHIVTVTPERYLAAEKPIEIVGKGERQTIEIPLEPAWGTVRVNTDPAGADLILNGRLTGITPQTAEPVQGQYRLEVSKDGWKPAFREFDIVPGQVIDFGTIRLERVDGKLSLASRPSDATVTIDGAFRGRTPVDISLVSGKTYTIRLTKPGYAAKNLTVAINPRETTPVSTDLAPEFGTVFLKTRPSGATLKVDGQPRGAASQRLRLQTRPHKIEISKPGYVTFSGSVAPEKSVSKRLNVQLKRQTDVLREKSRRSVTTPTGHRVRIVPIDGAVRFNMGASRREAGRRSNETLYPVELSKSFLIGETEVTNAEFRRFRRGHKSGTGLDDDTQPVVSITWDDAVRYLNWLSSREKLPPAYSEDGKRMVSIRPLTAGYRLPTEAEWVYAARYEAGNRPLQQPLKYPWGPSMPPASRSGNFADSAAAGLVPISIRGYADGFRRTAPVGSFPANAHGIRDLGGNVAEWVNDFYDASVGGRKLARDPVGPDSGRFHVVRGSSWRHGSITELRLSFRDYSDGKRDDIGFRIARYVQAPN
ncbi:MAG: PEGA domain-containing protein [Alphaproteobacteria bacterium]